MRGKIHKANSPAHKCSIHCEVHTARVPWPRIYIDKKKSWVPEERCMFLKNQGWIMKKNPQIIPKVERSSHGQHGESSSATKRLNIMRDRRKTFEEMFTFKSLMATFTFFENLK